MRALPTKNNVRFVISDQPSGNLATRRHDRRVTPYPQQMQALIDADLLTVVDLEAQMERRRSTLAEAHAEPPHVISQVWQGLMRALGCV